MCKPEDSLPKRKGVWVKRVTSRGCVRSVKTAYTSRATREVIDLPVGLTVYGLLVLIMGPIIGKTPDSTGLQYGASSMVHTRDVLGTDPGGRARAQQSPSSL